MPDSKLGPPLVYVNYEGTVIGLPIKYDPDTDSYDIIAFTGKQISVQAGPDSTAVAGKIMIPDSVHLKGLVHWSVAQTRPRVEGQPPMFFIWADEDKTPLLEVKTPHGEPGPSSGRPEPKLTTTEERKKKKNREG